MSGPTPIEWTDATWPIVAGCAPASPGCDHCYAARNTSGRLRNLPAYAGLATGGEFSGEIRLLPERLGWPLRQRKPRRIFVCSQSDLFHPKVPDEFIARTFAVMAAAPQHTFQILTKRAPARIGRRNQVTPARAWPAR
jgi:protein gp37